MREWVAWCLLACACPSIAIGQSPIDDAPLAPDARFAFAVVASDTSADERQTSSLLRAVGDGAARFVVHFERSAPSSASCTDALLDRRRTLLDASVRPLVPVVSTSSWADCGGANVDPVERLQRVDDVFFGSDESLGQTRMPWLRQSAIARFHRYRENLRWQEGRVLFATLNLPDNNNAFRIGAGRNGEFEERAIANRAWLERTFRLAIERRALGVVLFVDASPRFVAPLRAPDLRARERDGYYEWKVALRDAMSTYKGRVLLVQNRHAQVADRTAEVDYPLHDATGRVVERLARVAAPDAGDASRWMRVDVDPASPQLFTVSIERVFDDPSGELYGPARVK
jgi:hypothetical protein